MELTHMSLCTGIGGIDLAAEWAGFKTIAQCEIDEYASKVLAKNFKGVPNLHDIRTVTNERLAEYGIDRGAITVLSAGFPCQPYSLAGKGKGDGDERDLWGEVARCIGEIKPRWFVGENTPGLFARANQRYFKRILADLAALGYSVSWGIWGACDVGAPHQRKRVFIVAYADGDGRNAEQFQSGKSGETLDKAPKREFGGTGWLYGGIPDANGYGVGQFGEQKEIEKVRRREDNKRRRAKENAIGRWWQTEPDVGRVVTRCPHRVDRLRGLGNMVVPAQIYPLFEVIAEIERGDENGKQKTMWSLIAKKKVPPTRLIRYCCEELKEYGGRGRICVTGVRKAESVSRALNGGVVKIIGKSAAKIQGIDIAITPKRGVVFNLDNADNRRIIEQCYRTSKTLINPIIDWTDADIWEFSRAENIRQSELYVENGGKYRRLGCILCPMATCKEREQEARDYPQIKEAYIRAFQKMLDLNKDINYRWKTGEEVYEWWLYGNKKLPQLKGQLSMFSTEK